MEERVYVDVSGRPYRVVAPVEPRRRLYRPGASVNHPHSLRSTIPPPPPCSYYPNSQQQRLGTTRLANNRRESTRGNRRNPAHPSFPSPYYYDMNERRRASSGQPRQRRYHHYDYSAAHDEYEEDIPSHRHSRPSESRRSSDNGENRQNGRHSALQHTMSESVWPPQSAVEIVKEEAITPFISTGGGDMQQVTPKTAKTKSIINGSIINGSDQIAEDNDILVLEEEDGEEELGGDEHLLPTPSQRGRGSLRRRHSIGSAHPRSSLLEEVGAAQQQAERLARYSTNDRGTGAPLATSNRRRPVQGRLESSSHVMIDQAPLAPLREQARRRGPGHDFFEGSFGHLAYREDRRRMRPNNPLRRSNSDPSLDTDLGSFADYYVNIYDGDGDDDDAGGDDDDGDDVDTPSVSTQPVGFMEEDRSYYYDDDQSREYYYYRYNDRQGGYPPPSSGRPRVQRRHSSEACSKERWTVHLWMTPSHHFSSIHICNNNIGNHHQRKTDALLIVVQHCIFTPMGPHRVGSKTVQTE